jgi:hypothetical protein
MALRELLNSFTTKNLKNIIRAHNLHNKILLGGKREDLIDGLHRHYTLKNVNEIISKINSITLPTKEPAVKAPKRKTNITRKTVKLVEPVIEEQKPKEDENKTEQIVKAPKRKTNITRKTVKLVEPVIEEQKPKEDKEAKQKIIDHEIFLTRIRKQRADIQRKKDEVIEAERQAENNKRTLTGINMLNDIRQRKKEGDRLNNEANIDLQRRRYEKIKRDKDEAKAKAEEEEEAKKKRDEDEAKKRDEDEAKKRDEDEAKKSDEEEKQKIIDDSKIGDIVKIDNNNFIVADVEETSTPIPVFNKFNMEKFKETQTWFSSLISKQHSAVSYIPSYMWLDLMLMFIYNKYQTYPFKHIMLVLTDIPKNKKIIDFNIQLSYGAFKKEYRREGRIYRDYTYKDHKYLFDDLYEAWYYGVKVCIIPFTFTSTTIAHENCIIVKFNTFEIIHFEPHGEKFGGVGNADKINILVDKYLIWFVNNFNTYLANKGGVKKYSFKYVSSSEITPETTINNKKDKRGLQAFQSRSKLGIPRIEGGGFCALWSIFFCELILKNPDDDIKQIYKASIDFIGNNYDTYQNIIRGYFNYINDELDVLKKRKPMGRAETLKLEKAVSSYAYFEEQIIQEINDNYHRENIILKENFKKNKTPKKYVLGSSLKFNKKKLKIKIPTEYKK